jgi:hypothetical protein
MQNSPDNDFLKVTTDGLEMLILLLLKIGIQAYMRKKGISDWDEYTESLLKEYASLNPVNPMP